MGQHLGQSAFVRPADIAGLVTIIATTASAITAYTFYLVKFVKKRYIGHIEHIGRYTVILVRRLLPSPPING